MPTYHKDLEVPRRFWNVLQINEGTGGCQTCAVWPSHGCVLSYCLFSQHLFPIECAHLDLVASTMGLKIWGFSAS